MVSEFDQERLLGMYHRLKDVHRYDTRLYEIALNLSGKKDQYLQTAIKMIDKHGFLEALKLSKGDTQGDKKN